MSAADRDISFIAALDYETRPAAEVRGSLPGAGYASVSPSDFVSSASAPTSLINFQYAGHTVPNFGIIGVGEEGKIAIELVTPKVDGTARVIVDVFGFVATLIKLLREEKPDRIAVAFDSPQRTFRHERFEFVSLRRS